MENDGTHAIGLIPDTESCHIGALRLTNGILAITLKRDSVVLKTQTVLGVMNIGCLVCNWKNYNFSYSRTWLMGSQVFIRAGKDYLTISNQNSAVTIAANATLNAFAAKFHLLITENKLIFSPAKSDSRRIVSVILYDFAGRKLSEIQNNGQTAFEIPRPLTSGITCLSIKFSDGSVERQIVPLMR
jgi:hypothetical protein